MIQFLSLLTIPPHIQWLWLAHTLREKRTLLQVACGHFKSATKINCSLSQEFVCLSFPNHLKFRVKVVSLKGQESLKMQHTKSKFPMQFTDCNRPVAGFLLCLFVFPTEAVSLKWQMTSSCWSPFPWALRTVRLPNVRGYSGKHSREQQALVMLSFSKVQPWLSCSGVLLQIYSVRSVKKKKFTKDGTANISG